MKTITVTSYSLVERLNTDSTLYEIKFDDGTEALMLGREGEVEPYVGNLVDVEFRQDIYKNQTRLFVATIAERVVINTINRKNNIKLFSDTVDNSCNISFRDINIGDMVNNAVVYCNKVHFDASMRTNWIDLIVSDKNRYVSRIRMFAPDRDDVQFEGSYIKCDIRRNKYGFNTQEVTRCDGEYPPNPEVDIAEFFIRETFADSKQFMDAIEQTNIVPFLKEYVGYEKGCYLVMAAMEIDLAKEIANVTPAVKVDDLMKAFIVDKFWCLNSKARYSREFLCIHRALQYKDAIPPNVIDMISEKSQIVSPEREIYLQVKSLVKTIITMRRGEVDFDL